MAFEIIVYGQVVIFSLTKKLIKATLSVKSSY